MNGELGVERALHPDADRLVREGRHVLRLPVLLPTGRAHRVEQLLERDVRHGLHQVHSRDDRSRAGAAAHPPPRRDRRGRPRPSRAPARPCMSAGNERLRGCRHADHPAAHLVGRGLHEVAPVRAGAPAPDSGRNSIRPPSTTGPTGCSRYSNAVTTPKLPPPAAQRPEQVWVLVFARAHELAVRRHDLRGDEVVRGEPVLSLEPAAAASEREPGDAGRRDPPAGRRQADRLRRGVQLAPQHPALGARASSPAASTSMPFIGERSMHDRRRRTRRSRRRRGRRRGSPAAGPRSGPTRPPPRRRAGCGSGRSRPVAGRSWR